jgi:hypothetical protein
MRRRALLTLATMMPGVLLLGGGVALADTINGTSGADDLVGTDKEDVIHASGAKTTSPVWQVLMYSTLATTRWLAEMVTTAYTAIPVLMSSSVKEAMTPSTALGTEKRML